MLNFYINVPEKSTFLAENAEWIFPLIITIIFALVSWWYERRQKQLAEYEVGINLMEKRLAFFDKERVVLETLIGKGKLDQKDITNLCHVEHEALFLFGEEVKSHIDSVLSLADKRDSFSPVLIQDEYGTPTILNDSELDVIAEEATALFGEAISIYQLYIDFSTIGLAHTKEHNKRYGKKKVEKK